MMHVSWFVISRSAASNIDNARQGYVLVEDFGDVTFSAIMRMASDGSKNKIKMDAIQDHLPGRTRLFFLTRCPWWIRIPFRMMTPFMKPKMREKFQMVTPEVVAERLGGPQCLPPCLGGTLPEFHLSQIMDMFPELADVEIPINALMSGGGGGGGNSTSTKK